MLKQTGGAKRESRNAKTGHPEKSWYKWVIM